MCNKTLPNISQSQFKTININQLIINQTINNLTKSTTTNITQPKNFSLTQPQTNIPQNITF